MVVHGSSLPERFWAKVDIRSPGDCWEWTGCRSRYGYGRIGTGGRRGPIENASRVSWAIAHGPIPPGMEVCHRCDNPPCCNPAHLFLGTRGDNMRDCAAKGRTNKPRGEAHPCARFSSQQIADIRAAYARGDVSQALLGAQHGVSNVAISRIVRRVTWAHV